MIDWLKIDDEFKRQFPDKTTEFMRKRAEGIEKILTDLGCTVTNRIDTPWWAHEQLQEIMHKNGWRTIESFCYGDKCVFFGPIFFLHDQTPESYKMTVNQKYGVIYKPS